MIMIEYCTEPGWTFIKQSKDFCRLFATFEDVPVTIDWMNDDAVRLSQVSINQEFDRLTVDYGSCCSSSPSTTHCSRACRSCGSC